MPHCFVLREHRAHVVWPTILARRDNSTHGDSQSHRRTRTRPGHQHQPRVSAPLCKHSGTVHHDTRARFNVLSTQVADHLLSGPCSLSVTPPSPRVCVGRRAPTSGGRSRRSERLEMASALIWAARPLASSPPSHVNREAGVMSLCTCHQLESSAPVILLACRCFFSIAYSQMKASFRAQWKSFHWPAPLCGGDHTTRQYSLPRPRPPPPLGSVSSPRWFVRQLE